MTTFTHPKLLQEIQKACPELMENGFGTDIIFENDGEKNIPGTIVKMYAGLDETVVIEDARQKYAGRIFELHDSQIKTAKVLGKEPQIHHVLRALHSTGFSYAVDDFGQFMAYGDDENGEPYEWQTVFNDKRIIWNLSLGLYSQPTNVLDFLESLLVTK